MLPGGLLKQGESIIHSGIPATMEVARRISGDQGAAMAHVILTHHQIALLVQKASEGVVPGHVFRRCRGQSVPLPGDGPGAPTARSGCAPCREREGETRS